MCGACCTIQFTAQDNAIQVHRRGNAKICGASCVASSCQRQEERETGDGAGFDTMADAQSGMLEDANRIANRDQVSLDQVQQTAARGEVHVQGKHACSSHAI